LTGTNQRDRCLAAAPFNCSSLPALRVFLGRFGPEKQMFQVAVPVPLSGFQLTQMLAAKPKTGFEQRDCPADVFSALLLVFFAGHKFLNGDVDDPT
jgi:hypothetical protein